MTILELYIFFLPLIKILGTICLIALAAGSTLAVIVWFIKRTWKIIVAAGALTVVVVILQLALAVP